MPAGRPSYSNFTQMPEALRNFLFSPEFNSADDQLQGAYGLTDEQQVAMGDRVMDVVFNDATIQQSIDDLKAKFVPTPIAEENWKNFIGDYVKWEFWPMRDLFGEELTKVLQENRISTAGWPAFRVLLKPLTYGGAASEIAAMSGFVLAGPMRERLRDLIISKIKGVRIDAQVKEMLVRQSDFGGLGLDSETADTVINVMNRIISSVKIMTEDEYADWLAAETRKKTQAETSSAPLTDDDEEIEAIKAKMPKAPIEPQTVLDLAVEAVYMGIAAKPADEYLQKRLRYIISSRLRDVRNELELRALLQRDTKVGGLGLDRDAADKLSKQIEEGYKSFRERILAEEKTQLSQQMEEQKLKVEERRTREAEEHAQWYREKILARKQEDEAKQQLAERMKRAMVVGPTNQVEMHPMDVKEQKKETARFGEMVPAVSAGAVPVQPAAKGEVKPESKPGAPAQVVSPEKSVSAAAAARARSEVKISKASADMAAAMTAPRPRLDDVKFAGPRLTGPVQELKALTLSEFRRLAKDPEIAAQKIMQKIDVLGQESFERRVEGIKAWQQSSLQQTYMSLVTDSFKSGRPVLQLADEKRAKGEDVPSPAELSAVISLNSKLHF